MANSSSEEIELVKTLADSYREASNRGALADLIRLVELSGLPKAEIDICAAYARDAICNIDRAKFKAQITRIMLGDVTTAEVVAERINVDAYQQLGNQTKRNIIAGQSQRLGKIYCDQSQAQKWKGEP